VRPASSCAEFQVDFPIGKLSDMRVVTFLTLLATLVACGVLIYHVHLYSTNFKRAVFEKIVYLKKAQKVFVWKRVSRA
jgi:hypothetical protein